MQCGRVGGCRFFEFILEAGVPDWSTRLFLLEELARQKGGEEKEWAGVELYEYRG